MTLLPRSLFGRLTLLLLRGGRRRAGGDDPAVPPGSRGAPFPPVRRHQDRATAGRARGARRRAIRASAANRWRAIGHEYGVRIVPESERPFMRGPPHGPLLEVLEQRLREALGPDTELRCRHRAVADARAAHCCGHRVLGRPSVAAAAPGRRRAIARARLEPDRRGHSSRGGVPVHPFLARPLRELNAAVERVGLGEMPPPSPEHGPSEIVRLNRGFNQMTSNLRQLEEDRALLLAGVSR